MVSPEYNHAPSASLKNAIDWVYPEWNRKATTFVSYGGVCGARAVEHLRAIAVELQLTPVQSAIHVPVAALYAHFQNQNVTPHLVELDAIATTTINDLLWRTKALKTARSN